MGLRLYRVTDDHWHRLAAVRRARDLDGVPARTEIGAIETELAALHAADVRASLANRPRRESVSR